MIRSAQDFMTWKEALAHLTSDKRYEELRNKVAEESLQFEVQPMWHYCFTALSLTDYNNVRVVILGQDPYPGRGMATGLAFATPLVYDAGKRHHTHKSAASLNNIKKEVLTWSPNPNAEVNLFDWARQGVLLLNTVLTVRVGEPNSHRNIGWEWFTDGIIEKLNQDHNDLVFLLWGKAAQEKEKLIDTTKHLVLKAAHPSPFSANHGFLGCNHFLNTNNHLTSKGMGAINWYT